MNLTEEPLTDREKDVYNYLLEGLSYMDMAHELGIGKATIVTHVMRIFQKKLVFNRYELLANRIKELEKEVEELKGAKCITRVNHN